ncbi:MAG: lipase secretion chaperone [Aquabacterium sp.]
MPKQLKKESPMLQRGWMVSLVVAAALAAGGAWLWWSGQAQPSGDGNAAGAGGWSMIRSGVGATDGAAGGADGAPAALMTASQVRQRLFKEGSFQGTEPHGDWCARGEALQPCAGLRSRFEYYLLAIGEVPIESIRVLVADEAQRELGDTLASQVMSLYDKYMDVRRYQPRNQFQQDQLHTWMPVLAELRSYRRQVLGAEWAQAFYADEEAKFEQLHTQIQSGLPPPPDPGGPVPQMAPGKDPAAVHAERVARYGEEAAQRLAKVDAEWADWQRRLAAARQTWDSLQANNALSDVQRRQQMSAYVQQHFKDDEHLRVQALLKL